MEATWGESCTSPVDKTHSCMGTTIFFSHEMQRAMIKFALTVPSGYTVRSLPMLFVANLVSQAGLQNSVNLGRKALFCVDGMQSS